jgi:hypothetical protein
MRKARRSRPHAYSRREINTLPLLEALRARANDSAGSESSLLAAAHLLERLDRTISRLARDNDTVTELA